MLGRRVAVVIRWPTATRARPVANALFAARSNASIRAFSALTSRLEEVTIHKPGRPKKHVGTTSTRKRAVKPKATGEAKEQKTSVKKTTSAKKKTAVKKKTPVKKKKKAAAAKKKKVAPKPKKELTEAQKLAKSTRDRLVKIRALKKLALSPPSVRIASAYTAFGAEKANDFKVDGKSTKEDFSRVAKERAELWRSLSPAEIEHYNHLAHTRHEDSINEYKKWVQSHSVTEIAAANSARQSLRRLLDGSKKKGTKTQWPAIQDERMPKRPETGFVLFLRARASSPDFNNISPQDRLKLVATEWKALSAAEKAKYDDQHAQQSQEYQRWQEENLGREPRKAKQAAAATT